MLCQLLQTKLFFSWQCKISQIFLVLQIFLHYFTPPTRFDQFYHNSTNLNTNIHFRAFHLLSISARYDHRKSKMAYHLFPLKHYCLTPVLLIANHILRTAYYKLHTVYYTLHITHCRTTRIHQHIPEAYQTTFIRHQSLHGFSDSTTIMIKKHTTMIKNTRLRKHHSRCNFYEMEP